MTIRGVVTNWSQKGEIGKWPNEVGGETLSSKDIAGAPGGTIRR